MTHSFPTRRLSDLRTESGLNPSGHGPFRWLCYWEWMRSRLTGMTMPVLRPEVGTMKVNKSMRLTAAVTAVALLSGCGIFKGKSGPKTPVVGERIPILTAESSVKVDPSIADVQVVLPAPEIGRATSELQSL